MPNKPVTLYLDHSAPPTVVPVSQGDTDWTYVFTVMNNGEVYSPDVTYVIITGHKPDGNVFAFLGSKSGSRYQLVANGQLVQMTAVPGDVSCELRLMKNGRSIGTTNFILRVEPGPEGVVTVASASALPAYVTILNQLAGIMAQAESIPSDIGGYISDWLEAHISGGQGVAVDNTLTVQGAAADAKKTGDEIKALQQAVEDVTVETDATLSVAGAPADAAAVGSRFGDFFAFTEEGETYQNLLNLRDPDVQNGYALSTTGAISAASGKSVTGFIPITAGQWYAFHYEQSKAQGGSGGMFITLYDANKQYTDYWKPVSDVRSKFGTDSNGKKYVALQMRSSAAYFRYTVDTADAQSFYMLVESDTMPGVYVPYGSSIVVAEKSLKPDVYVSGADFTESVKAALLACLEHVWWDDAQGLSRFNALGMAIYPPADVGSISAAFIQGDTIVRQGDALDTLRSMLTVTIHMKSGANKTVSWYSLSGTLRDDPSTITVSYGSHTATFDVVVASSEDEDAPLPSSYQEVEWIESSGTQLINTGINITSDAQHLRYSMEVDLSVPVANSSTAVLFSESSEAGYYIANVSSGTKIGISASLVFENVDITTRNTFTLAWTSSQGVATCGGQTQSRARTAKHEGQLTLFGDYEKLFLAKCRIYRAVIRDNDSVVRNLVPCYRKSDGVIGMYDKITHAFFTNTGTGTFTKGADAA